MRERNGLAMQTLLFRLCQGMIKALEAPASFGSPEAPKAKAKAKAKAAADDDEDVFRFTLQHGMTDLILYRDLL